MTDAGSGDQAEQNKSSCMLHASLLGADQPGVGVGARKE
jgi:hypothetical protein